MRDVAVVAQRLEMVSRIAREIEDYVLELGTDGRLLSLQLEELVTGVDAERELVVRDYLPGGRRAKPAEAVLAELEALSPDRAGRPRPRRAALGLGQGEHLDGAVAPRGYRLLAKVPRLPSAVVDRLVEHFGTPAEAALGRRRGPAGGRGRRRAARPQRARGPLPAGRVDASSSATSEPSSNRRADELRRVVDPTRSGCAPRFDRAGDGCSAEARRGAADVGARHGLALGDADCLRRRLGLRGLA